MPIIPPQGPYESSESQGMASLQVASAHLATLLSATDTLDSKAMFLAAVNLALFAAFVGAIVGLSLSGWAILAPGFAVCALLTLGWLCVKPRTISQFNEPAGLLQNRQGGWTDHFLAWYYIEALSEASDDVVNEIERKGTYIRVIAFGTLLHVVALLISAAVVWASASSPG
ncbi:MAG: hypothetical protein OXD50_03685 [Chloroflexi bacterium]|nr:hypothetical protein [Chloroflexota bacterium]